MGLQLPADSIAKVSLVPEVNGTMSVTPQSLAHFPGPSVQWGPNLREAGQGQVMLCYPWNFMLELCYHVELSVLMEVFYNVYCSTQ